MAAETVHKTVSVRCAPVAEEDHHLVQALRVKAQEIPHHCRALEIGLRITFLGMNEVGKFLRILDEEDGVLFPTRSQLPSSV